MGSREERLVELRSFFFFFFFNAAIDGQGRRSKDVFHLFNARILSSRSLCTRSLYVFSFPASPRTARFSHSDGVEGSLSSCTDAEARKRKRSLQKRRATSEHDHLFFVFACLFCYLVSLSFSSLLCSMPSPPAQKKTIRLTSFAAPVSWIKKTSKESEVQKSRTRKKTLKKKIITKEEQKK